VASKPASSWAELEKQILAKIASAQNVEVAQTVKLETQKAVDEKIYKSGTPVWYDRRDLTNGSLGDINEMSHDVNISGSEILLEVRDEAKPKLSWDQDLTFAITYGYGSKDQWWNEPRDFLEEARQNMRNSKSHVEAMRKGLIREGIIVV